MVIVESIAAVAAMVVPATMAVVAAMAIVAAIAAADSAVDNHHFHHHYHHHHHHNNCHHISKIYFSHWEPLGVLGSCWARIPEWSNLAVDWTNELAFKCTLKRWQQICKDIGDLVTSWGALRNAGDKSGSTSNHCRVGWEISHILWECCWCMWKS